MQKELNEDKIDSQEMTLDALKDAREKLREKQAKVSLDDHQTLINLSKELRTLNHKIVMCCLVTHKHRPNI